MSAGGADRIALAVDIVRGEDAIPGAVSEVAAAAQASIDASNRVADAAIAASARQLQAGRSLMDMEYTTVRARMSTADASAAAAAKEVQLAALVSAAISENVRLIQLKARAVDVSSQEAVAAFMAEAQGQREAIAAEQGYEAELAQVDIAMKSVTSQAAAMAAAQARAAGAGQQMNVALNGMPQSRLRTGAMAVERIGFAAQSATLDGTRAVSAFGQLATTISMMTGGPFAMWASGIGAAVILLGTVIALIEKANAEAKAPDSFVSRMEHWDLRGAKVQMDEINARIDEATKRLNAVDPLQGTHHERTRAAIEQQDLIKQLGVLQAEKLKLSTKLNESLLPAESKKERAERDRIESETDKRLQAGKALLEIDRRKIDMAQDEYASVEKKVQLELLGADIKHANAVREIKDLTEIKDSTGRVTAIDEHRRQVLLEQAAAERTAEKDRIEAEAERARVDVDKAASHREVANYTAGPGSLDAKMGTAGAAYQERLALIEEERKKRIAQHEDVAKAAKEAEQEIQKARLDTLHKTESQLGQIATVMAQSHSRSIRAVGEAANTMRRLLIGAEGAHSAVLALKEGAAAISDAASGNFAGAALHAVSSIQYAAAAAMAAQESLGGSSGASGGASAGASTFTPNDNGKGGSVTVNLITRDPYGRDSIAQTMFELQRSGDLKRTVPIAPTSALLPVAA